ncbi:hypothetical protein U1Q18_023336, partial [Sarracenia purpurea var. burkii]
MHWVWRQENGRWLGWTPPLIGKILTVPFGGTHPAFSQKCGGAMVVVAANHHMD